MTSEELARKAGLHERWVREWVQGQATAGLVDYVGQGRFTLSPEAAMVLADETSPAFAAGGFHGLAQQMAVLDLLPDAFRTGQGFPYDALGREGAVGVERMLAPWFRTQLVPVALPALDGVVPKLERGARVADVGCGAGIALLQMAAAFPRSEFHGYEVSEHALARAEDNRRAAGAANVRFHDVRHEALAGPFDLVTTFDCLHDMAHPMRAMRAIREAIAPDGTWLIADVNCKATFASR
jgi:2-polyprenyl-3-methyl-5-hydroxy-6-metoxy-1,4-benzoquinol methylase